MQHLSGSAAWHGAGWGWSQDAKCTSSLQHVHPNRMLTFYSTPRKQNFHSTYLLKSSTVVWTDFSNWDIPVLPDIFNSLTLNHVAQCPI